jgi:hypothetical protein
LPERPETAATDDGNKRRERNPENRGGTSPSNGFESTALDIPIRNEGLRKAGFAEE